MDSLRKRFAVRFSTQVISGVILLLTQSFMLRGLGPKWYGDYNFTTQFFTQVTAFLDFGVTTAFFTKLSQRPNDMGLIRFYYGFWAVLTVVQVLFVAIAFGTPFAKTLWPAQTYYVVGLAMLWAVFNSVWQGTSRIADAYALTVRSEKYKVLMRVFSLAVILPFFFTKTLNLPLVFGSQVLGFVVLTLMLYRMARPQAGVLWGSGGGESLGFYFREMREFCLPLLVYSGASVVSGLFDSWMLQRYGGSVQQGFLGLSNQLSLICLLFCSAMLPLIHREFSVAFAKKQGAEAIYQKCVPPIVAASTFIALYIAVNGREMVRLFSGPEYAPAVSVVVVGILYTIPQCFSQMTGCIFYASGRTTIFRNLGLLSCFLGVPLTLILVGPGWQAGAAGLVAKMLVVALIIMLFQIYFTAQQLQLSFFAECWRYLRMYSVLGLGAYSSYLVSRALFEQDILCLVSSLIWFCGFAAVVVFFLPSWLGLTFRFAQGFPLRWATLRNSFQELLAR